MVLDVRMQLDINVQMRQIPRPQRRPPRDIIPLNESHDSEVVGAGDDASESSWTTFEEQEMSDQDLDQ